MPLAYPMPVGKEIVLASRIQVGWRSWLQWNAALDERTASYEATWLPSGMAAAVTLNATETKPPLAFLIVPRKSPEEPLTIEASFADALTRKIPPPCGKEARAWARLEITHEAGRAVVLEGRDEALAVTTSVVRLKQDGTTCVAALSAGSPTLRAIIPPDDPENSWIFEKDTVQALSCRFP